jgi:hypothetical protein
VGTAAPPGKLQRNFRHMGSIRWRIVKGQIAEFKKKVPE